MRHSGAFEFLIHEFVSDCHTSWSVVVRDLSNFKIWHILYSLCIVQYFVSALISFNLSLKKSSLHVVKICLITGLKAVLLIQFLNAVIIYVRNFIFLDVISILFWDVPIYGESSRSSKHSDVQHSDLSSWECAYSSSITEEDEGVCWCALVIGLKGSYVDLLMYHLIPEQITGLHKQKASGNKIKIQT
jgi:hypothetical protein